jgi:tetratricopeptide (TPR) repeat protein
VGGKSSKLGISKTKGKILQNQEKNPPNSEGLEKVKRNLLIIILFIIVITMLSGCSTAGTYYKDGKKCFESGEYEKAASYFSKAVEKNPDRADYYIDYGMALIALGKYEAAIEQLQLAYMDKDLSIVKENNKRILRGIGIAYYSMQSFEKAADEFQKALKIEELPELNEDILYYMGSSLRSIGSYEKAMDTYSAILKSDNKSATAYADRAFCYRYMGMYEKSLADYDSAIKLESDNYEFYFGKYFLLMEFGDTAQAKEVLSQAAATKAVTEEDKYSLAKIHYYQESYDTALTELQNCFDAGINEACYYIGEIYRNKKDYTNAIYYYENYIGTGKVITPNVYNQAAVCLIKTGEYNKAIEYLDAGIAYNNADTLQLLKKNEIIAYENLGQFDIADEKLKEYVTNYPEDKDAVREAEFIDTRLTKDVVEESNE